AASRPDRRRHAVSQLVDGLQPVLERLGQEFGGKIKLLGTPRRREVYLQTEDRYMNSISRHLYHLRDVRLTNVFALDGREREGIYPLRKDFDLSTALPAFHGPRHVFRPVEGEGVFQVPVGPIHAGIIEPGHFRFSVAGEPILYLQIRLFYTHKATEKLFEQKS